MPIITCQATSCRFNARHRCTLAQIRVGPADIPQSPEVLGVQAAAYDGQLRAGYATEFEDYTAYARQQFGSYAAGATCLSFSPLAP